MATLPPKQTRLKTSLPYCLHKVDSRFFKLGDAANTKIRFTKLTTVPNRRTSVSQGIEPIRDRWGIEAHSDVEVYTDKNFEDVEEAENFAIQVINRFVKSYRYYDTEAVHLVPLIREDLFGLTLINPQGEGVIGVALGGGMRVYDPMRTQLVSDAIEGTLREKEAVPLWAELMLNAEQYLYQGDYRHSVLESVIGLEVVLAAFITKACTEKGILEKEAEKFIEDVGITGNIKITLRLLLDPSIQIEDEVLQKCKGGITIRNKIVHEGRKDVTETEAKDTLTHGRKLTGKLLPFI